MSLKEDTALGDLIAGLCIAKNEADIIEAMVRHNLAFLDRLHVVDNDSTDGTLAILKLLGLEFFGRLTWSTDERTGHMQKNIINELLPALHPDMRISHVVVLDADEFISAEPQDFRAQLLASDAPVQLPWVTYVPTAHDDMSEPNPIMRIKRRRRRERPQHFKVTIPGRLLGKALVRAGGRQLKGKNMPAPISLPGITLAHFPVRSREQLISKVLIGSWSVRFRGPLKGKEAYHWHALAARILAGDLLSDSDIHLIALNYAADKEVALMRDPLRDHCGPLRYTEDGPHLLLRNLIAFTESCVIWREAQQPESQTADN